VLYRLFEMYSRTKALLIHFLFALSGAATMGTHLIWLRQFEFGLGQETAAMLGVMGGYWAGFAAGAWLQDRPISATRRPGTYYGILEISAGLWTMVSVFLVPRFTDLTHSLTGVDSGGILRWGVALALPALALFPATMARGGLFAAMERVASPLIVGGRCAGSLYSMNTLGAAVGAISCNLLLAPEFGYSRSLLLFGGSSCLAGILVWAVLPHSSGQGLFVEHGGKLWNLFFGVFPSAEERSSVLEQGIAGLRLPLTLAGVGLFGMGYPICGERLLNHYLANTVFTHTAILTACLLSTGLGALLTNHLFRDHRLRDRLGSVSAGLAAACTLGLVAIAFLADWQPGLTRGLPFSKSGFFWSEALTALVVFGPASLLTGALLGALLQWCRDQKEGIGYALACSTVGTLAAPILFGVLLPPAVGTLGAALVVSAGYLALVPRWRLSARLLAGVTLLLAAISIWHLQVVFPNRGERVLATREGFHGTATVLITEDNQRLLRVNNQFSLGGDSSAKAERRRAHLPLLLHHAPKQALFLGTATGIGFEAAALYPNLAVRGLESAAEIAALQSFFNRANHTSTQDARVQRGVADPRRFIQETREAYDVIVADLAHPARDGAARLCTREHFQSIRAHLRPRGLFCQWLPLHRLDIASFRSIVRTYLDVFPEAYAILPHPDLDNPVIGLLAGLEALPLRGTQLLIEPLPEPLGSELNAQEIQNVVQVYGHLLAGPRSLRSLAAEGVANTDDRPFLLFQVPQFPLQRDTSTEGRLIDLMSHRGLDLSEELGPLMGASDLSLRLQRCLTARDIYLLGLIAEKDGSPKGAV
jgi:spermidine synthase